ncbi:hypothetical protein [Hyalangium rubrum]|uniref:Lipoprotein n=1 Tax=Hyalangium rubrum TaxID=3103134 RepID=A0ABU5H2M3_9BACT|nr:hypothetical protein [Hyalangium sp. s54d21]MDY7227717.1 hypothetical protein [Hyalangium sp. s54d21]
MTSLRAVVLSSLLCLSYAPSALAKEKKPSGGAKPSETKRLELVERSSTRGFAIKVPSEATGTQDDWSMTYKTLVAPDSTPINVVVSVESLDEFTPVTNLDKAVESITSKRRPGALKPPVSEQRELPNGYLVVLGPQYDTHAVHVIRNGKEVQVKADCTGPSSRLEALKEMCLSVKPTK